MSAYRRLEDRFKRITLLEEATGVLHWDMSTMMPPGGAVARGEQLATLSVLAHELMTDPAVGEWLAAAGDDDPVVENKVAENKVADDQLAGGHAQHERDQAELGDGVVDTEFARDLGQRRQRRVDRERRQRGQHAEHDQQRQVFRPIHRIPSSGN